FASGLLSFVPWLGKPTFAIFTASQLVALLVQDQQGISVEERAGQEAQLHREGIRQIQVVVMLKQESHIGLVIHLEPAWTK
ncbi:MAG: hypothetical protein J7559_07500, partial [Cohnella sp.]|nr:hypothetical protein [Cohnella sp.]